MKKNNFKRGLTAKIAVGLVLLLLLFASIFVFGCTGLRSGGGNVQIAQLSAEPFSGEIGERRIVINQETLQFEVDGKRIWMNGANTPWHNWNDFGNTWSPYNNQWWDAEFAKLRNAGINSTRVWINCDNGHNAILMTDEGMTLGISGKFWTDLDALFETARKHEIYIMATLLSFDHFKSDNRQAYKWLAMIKNRNAIASLAENYTIPFVQRYGDNPYLWSIDLINEPDWVHEQNRIPWHELTYFLAYQAAAIHANSHVLVTVGMVYPKWMSRLNGSGNYISDELFRDFYDNPNAYLDFHSPHYYDWVGEWYGVPYYLNPSGNIDKTSRPWTGGWGLDETKPAVLGEVPARGSGNRWGFSGKTVITDYEEAFNNGWEGVMAWTSNGVDGNGGLNLPGDMATDLDKATLNMLNKYRELIFPWD